VRRTPALIVGGGPAGAAAAIGLARAGLRPEIIERTTEGHDVVCGGFLGWDALAALRKLGLDPDRLGARPITQLRLISSRKRVEAALPKAAAGLSRRLLDEAMLEAARDAGALVTRGRTVREADGDKRIVRLDDGEERACDALLLATGKHELRGTARPRDTSQDPVGLRTALAPSSSLEKALDGVIELHLFNGGYAGLLLQEDGCANLCLSVARRRIRAAGGIPALLKGLTAELPALCERLGQAEVIAWSAISGVPYGWSAKETVPGLFRLGDQGAVIASLAGDGIAIALTSGIEAAALFDAGAGAYQARLARRAAVPLAVAEGLRWAAERELPRRFMLRLVDAFPHLPGVAARLTRIGA
jgi:flavin-dependent dehydrogenase